MIIKRAETSKFPSLDQDHLVFGRTFTDHMIICEYDKGSWGEVQLRPYGPLEFTPANMAFNYGQACFEGLKAYKDHSGEVFLFRPDKNFERMNKSAIRLAMPEIPEKVFMEGLKALVDLDRQWVLQKPGYSMYLRPVYFAASEHLKADVSDRYIFAIVACPVGAYYDKPVSVLVADHYSRSANGGVGFAKFAGNYAGAFYPTKLAKEKGYDQIIWTDDATHTLMEESGTMNVMVRIDDTIYTPPTSDRILDGVTRRSFLELADKIGLKIVVAPLKVADVYKAHKEGRLKEAWGVGTAAVVSVINAIGYGDEHLDIPAIAEEDSFALKMKKALVGIQTNTAEDPFGWRVKVEKGYADSVK